jgi:hypothetical protein
LVYVLKTPCCAGLQASAAEEKAALVEAEVRDEVSNEMADLLRDMEANYRVNPPASLSFSFSLSPCLSFFCYLVVFWSFAIWLSSGTNT